MSDFRNKKVHVEYDRALVGFFEIDDDLELIPNENVTWDKDAEEFQIKNTRGIKFKDYEISYFFVYLDINTQIPSEIQGDIYIHAQAVIKINDEDECYYDPHQKKFFYSGIDDAIEFETWQEVLDQVANKNVVIRTIKY